MFPLKQSSWLGIYHSRTFHPYWQWVWANFDGVNYLDIVRHGYFYPNFAYFPLLPLLIYIVNMILPPLTYTQIGSIISNLAFLGALFVIYRIVLLDYPQRIAWRTLLLLVSFPFAYFYSAVYTDALFLFLSTLSFYYARKGSWVRAGSIGYLAGLARLVGATLVPALLLEWYLQQPKNKRTLKKLISSFFQQKAYAIAFADLGMVTYSLYLYLFYGDFLLFQKSMAAWEQAQIVFPLQVGFRYIKLFLFFDYNFLYFVAAVEFVTTMLYFALTFYVTKKVRLSYGVFMLFVLLIPTLTGTLQSMPRYMLHLFPGFIALSVLTSKSKTRFRTTLLLFILLQIFFFLFFARGYFIA